eukprot:Seg221.3 transcript_id=Seg221.3/GoldUCD/mRNA.D3Y31 product=Streptavidin-V2 protein_id=Seg221.3/GoldUCD/D3Y31
MKTAIILSTLYCLCSGFYIESKKTPDNVAPLTGTWVTESGTYIDITQNADGSLTGKYYSLGVDGNAAESEVIHGQAGDGKPTTFGMVVAFKDGKSTKAWTGQYQFCGSEATLMTRWMLTSLSKSCGSQWKSNHSGEDIFVRKSAGKRGSKRGHYIRKMFKKILREHLAKRPAQN